MLAFKMNELERSLSEAKAAGKEVRALTVINPGNPTGNCLAPENMREVVRGSFLNYVSWPGNTKTGCLLLGGFLC